MSEVFVHQAIHGLGPYNGFLHAFMGTFIKESVSLKEDLSSNTSPRHTSTKVLDPYLHNTLISGKKRELALGIIHTHQTRSIQ